MRRIFKQRVIHARSNWSIDWLRVTDIDHDNKEVDATRGEIWKLGRLSGSRSIVTRNSFVIQRHKTINFFYFGAHISSIVGIPQVCVYAISQPNSNEREGSRLRYERVCTTS